MKSIFPERYLNLDRARNRFGDRVEELGKSFYHCDPLADRLIASFSSLGQQEGWNLFEQALEKGIRNVKNAQVEMVDFFESVEEEPQWLDFEVINRGGEPLLRATAFAALTLGLKSLVLGYCSPGGNKPLVFSGRLNQMAGRRLNETAKFVYEVSLPNGMRRGAPGYKIVLRVRLIHAQIRQLIQRSDQWQPHLWGEPINQHDMVATLLLFSVAFLEGLGQFGFHISDDEAAHQVFLWRYVGHVMGVSEKWIPKTVAESYELGELIAATQGPPDQDSRNLAQALLRAPMEDAKSRGERRWSRQQIQVAVGMCRHLIGDDLADQLDLPRTGWRHLIPVVRQWIRAGEMVSTRRQGSKHHAVKNGMRKWETFLEKALDGQMVSYSLPTRLRFGNWTPKRTQRDKFK